MIKSARLQWILAAAVSLTLAGSAMAQYRVGNDGRALDANNRVGSNGSNGGGGAAQRFNIGNDIVTGNVTGGRQFRGSVPYGSSTAFRGAISSGLSDQFIRQSSGTPYGNLPQNNAQVVQPFFGDSNAAPPPAGFVSQGLGSGAYVPSGPITRGPGDLRMGAAFDSNVAVLPQPGQLLLPGPVDPNTQNSTLITASPLYGVRQWDPNAAADQSFLNNNLNRDTSLRTRIDPATLQKMRSDLVQPQQQDQTGTPDQNKGPQTLDTMMPGGFEAPQNRSLSNAKVSQAAQNFSNTPLTSSLVTGASMRQRLIAPQQQSSQYAEMTRRLQQYRTIQAQTNADSQTEYNRQVARARQEKANAAAAGGTGTAPLPNFVVPGPADNGIRPLPQPTPIPTPLPANPQVTEQPQPTTPVMPEPAPSETPQVNANPNRPAPVQIKSLADGVQSASLAEMLKEAEAQMKAGKFNSALQQYALAEQVAPNNPLILMGRANAELGSSYFKPAATHLRDALSQNPELLMGQIDLKSWIGAERLDFIVRDLKAVADSESKDSQPVFLLAYIAYNTGNELRAAAYLELAETRAGGKDEFYSTVRKHWSLPAAATPADANK